MAAGCSASRYGCSPSPRRRSTRPGRCRRTRAKHAGVRLDHDPGLSATPRPRALFAVGCAAGRRVDHNPLAGRDHRVLTENVAYPACVWALWGIWQAAWGAGWRVAGGPGRAHPARRSGPGPQWAAAACPGAAGRGRRDRPALRFRPLASRARGPVRPLAAVGADSTERRNTNVVTEVAMRER